MPTSLFSRLPPEILLEIAEYCNESDLRNLMACNRHFYGTLHQRFLRLAVPRCGGQCVQQAAYDGNLPLLRTLHNAGAPLAGQWGIWNSGQLFPPPSTGQLAKLCRPDPSCAHWQIFTALDLAVLGRNWSNPKPKNQAEYLDVVSWLIDNGVNVDGNHRDLPYPKYGPYLHDTPNLDMSPFWVRWTALSLAISRKDEVLANLLIHKGASLGKVTFPFLEGVTALRVAVATRSIGMIKLVLNFQGCDVNAVDPVGKTALWQAINSSDYTFPAWNRYKGCQRNFDTLCPRLLLNAGASLSIEDHTYSLPWTQLVSDRLLQNQPPLGSFSILPMHTAAKSGNFQAMVVLIKAGADVNSLSGGHFPLHCAVADGCRDDSWSSMAEVQYRPQGDKKNRLAKLIASGAYPNCRTRVLASGNRADLTPGATPLMYAMASHCYLETIQFLIDNGADVKAKDSSGQTALHWLITPLFDRRHYIYIAPYPMYPLFYKIGEEYFVRDDTYHIINLLAKHGCPLRHRNILGHSFTDLMTMRLKELYPTADALPKFVDGLFQVYK
jgi:ankyrin repeat protein